MAEASNFVHPQALCESQQVGPRTRVWAFAHVLPEAKVGADCNICDHVFIENDVVVGDRVTIKCGVQLWDGVRLEDDVFIGPNVTLTNDLFPRSRVRPAAFNKTVIRRYASVGANATLLSGIVIGQGALVGAGAVVTRSVPDHAVVVGNPARVVGFVDQSRGQRLSVSTQAVQAHLGTRLVMLPTHSDSRGSLSVAEFDQTVPFSVQRAFLITAVPDGAVRGEHAHFQCHQFLVCTQGSCSVMTDSGCERHLWRLESPGVGLYMPPGVWGVQYDFSADASLMVFASHRYDAADYIREYSHFQHWANQARKG